MHISDAQSPLKHVTLGEKNLFFLNAVDNKDIIDHWNVLFAKNVFIECLSFLFNLLQKWSKKSRTIDTAKRISYKFLKVFKQYYLPKNYASFSLYVKNRTHIFQKELYHHYSCPLIPVKKNCHKKTIIRLYVVTVYGYVTDILINFATFFVLNLSWNINVSVSLKKNTCCQLFIKIIIGRTQNIKKYMFVETYILFTTPVE